MDLLLLLLLRLVRPDLVDFPSPRRALLRPVLDLDLLVLTTLLVLLDLPVLLLALLPLRRRLLLPRTPHLPTRQKPAEPATTTKTERA